MAFCEREHEAESWRQTPDSHRVPPSWALRAWECTSSAGPAHAKCSLNVTSFPFFSKFKWNQVTVLEDMKTSNTQIIRGIRAESPDIQDASSTGPQIPGSSARLLVTLLRSAVRCALLLFLPRVGFGGHQHSCFSGWSS